MQKDAEKNEQQNVELIPFLESNQNKLVKFDEFKAKQEQLVKENPYVEITDSKSYEEAKKARTNLKTGRTEIQSGDKKIASFFTKFRKALKGKAEELVAITKDAEDKQQAEVTRWENIKKEEKEKKAKAEELRIENIKNKVSDYKEKASELINNCTFPTIEPTREALNKLFTEDAKEFDFAEFELLLDAEEEAANLLFDNRASELTRAEDDRLKQIEDGQKAKYNEVKLHALETIDEATTDDLTIVEDLTKYFDALEFDFGPFLDDVIALKETSIEKATKRVESLKEQAAKDKELADLKAKKEKLENIEAEGKLLEAHKTEVFADIQALGNHEDFTARYEEIKGNIKAFAIEGLTEEHIKQNKEMFSQLNDELEGKLEAIKQQNEKAAKERIERLATDKEQIMFHVNELETFFNEEFNGNAKILNKESLEFVDNLKGHFKAWIEDVKESAKTY